VQQKEKQIAELQSKIVQLESEVSLCLRCEKFDFIHIHHTFSICIFVMMTPFVLYVCISFFVCIIVYAYVFCVVSVV